MKNNEIKKNKKVIWSKKIIDFLNFFGKIEMW